MGSLVVHLHDLVIPLQIQQNARSEVFLKHIVQEKNMFPMDWKVSE